MSTSPQKIVITTGDEDGIGTEVVAKALAKISPKANVHFYLWRSPRCPKKFLRIIDSKYKRTTVHTWAEALKQTPSSAREIIDIESNLSPAKWVELTAKASHFGHVDAIATAPLSKKSIRKAGYKEIGHTEILKKVAGVNEVFMAFMGRNFNVVLATGHIPLHQVKKQLTGDRLELALRASLILKSLLPDKKAKLPIAMVGMNPHAGENKLIGSEEDEIYKPVLTNLRKGKNEIEGPLVPDVAFQRDYWKKYSVYVSPYHDQGLIPFKLAHGKGEGVHITLGLPFVRTSVDHGTAKDIFGRNKANPESMKEAIQWAIKLSKALKEKKIDLRLDKKAKRS